MAVQKSQSARMAVRKAKPDESWVACYDADGTLIGIVDPTKITPVTNASAGKPRPAAPKAAPKQPPAAAPAPTADQQAMAKQQRIAALRKGLVGPGLAADGDQLVRDMNVAAARVLKQIHSGRRTA